MLDEYRRNAFVATCHASGYFPSAICARINNVRHSSSRSLALIAFSAFAITVSYLPEMNKRRALSISSAAIVGKQKPRRISSLRRQDQRADMPMNEAHCARKRKRFRFIRFVYEGSLFGATRFEDRADAPELL